MMSSLYIHIPFCKQKCLYCNFYSQSNLNIIDDFIRALKKEMELRASNWKTETFKTLYFGGGTPSLLSINQFQNILESVFKYFKFSQNPEITIEVNPENMTSQYLKNLRNIGFNRISIGVQSSYDSILKYLGRKHLVHQALYVIQESRYCGFDNISADLIYGIQGLSDEMWHNSLKTLLDTEIQHLSAYALTLEENSILWHKIQQHKAFKPDEEQAERQFKILMDIAEQYHFEHYEISNFARPDYRSQHNSSYWYHQPYLGLGTAAHSLHHQIRYWNKNSVLNYIESMNHQVLFYESERLSENDLYNEFVMLHLRLKEGLNINELEKLFGTHKRNYFLHEIQSINSSHYAINNDQVYLTEKGKFFADAIASQLFYVS